uniref:ANK_REP_REGION domain-containing protein n=1 Tax=Angiostrongylus cantonensis TaxID=6313 RepID=A0A158P9B4_ANGCA
MKVLLDAGADIEARNSLEHTALQCAVLAGHLGTVRQLLDKGAAMENKDDKSDSTALHLASTLGHDAIVRLLLERGATVDRRDEHGRTAFDLAVEHDHREVAYVLLESENWMSIMSPMDELPIGRHSIARDTPLRKLIRKYPELAAKLLSTVSPYKANGTLRQGAKAYSDDYDVVYKNHPLKMMAKCEVLLSHPLVLALLKHKWNNLGRYVYYFALAIYLLFLCAYTLYVTHTPAPFNVYDEDRGVLLDLTAILVSGEPECPRIKLTRPPWLISCKWVVVSLAIAQLFKENWQWLVAAVCAFLSWMNLLLLIRKLPRFGIYVVMFFDVLRTFSRFFIVFALFVVAFSIAFFVMMQNRPEFSSVPSAVLKTTVMMIGEFEFTAIFHGDAESHPERLFGHAIAYLIFLFFCVIMTILLMNLLVGLAVDDIKSVLEEAKLKRLSMQADLVLQIEASIPYIRKLTSRSSVRIYPNRTSFLKRLRNRFGFDSSTAVLMEEDWQSREEELLIEFRQVIKEQNDRIRHLQENIDVIYAGQLHAETMIRSIMEQLQIDFQQTDKI